MFGGLHKVYWERPLEYVNPDKRHQTYWRTHGCEKEAGHTDPCQCVCCEFLEATDTPFGDGVETAVARGTDDDGSGGRI